MRKLVPFLCIVILGCTREVETSTLTLTLPSGMESQNVSAQSAGDWNTSLNPSVITDVNCYAVFVGGPEPMMNSSSCSYSPTNEVKMRFGRFRGLIPGGGTVEIDVPSGPNRKIWLVGLKSQNGACTDFGMAAGPDKNNLSEPHIIAETIRNLPPGPVNVTLTQALDLNNKFDQCTMIGGDGGGGLNFGTGIDGNRSISIPISDISADTSVFASSRYFSDSSRIINVDTITGRTLTLDNTFSSMSFSVGDEVMWIVNAAGDNPTDNGVLPGSDSVCSGSADGLHRGRHGFATVTAVAPPQITISNPVYGYPTINNTALARIETNQSTYDFCKMQLIRVPNFQDLTVTATSSLGVPPYSLSSGVGGFAVIKVNGTLTLTADLTVNATAKGFPGGSAGSFAGQGHSSQGSGTNITSSNDTGGGGGAMSTTHAGGGGNGGAGGDGTVAGSRGAAVTWCSVIPCRPSEKMMMGSGGGGGMSTQGGNGGGVVILLAKNINLTGGSLLIDSNGGNGTSGSFASGGGAGGNVLIYAKNVLGAGTFTVNANGGNGVTAQSGVGGAGVVEVRTCDRSAHSGTLTLSSTMGPIGAKVGAQDAVPIDVPNDAGICGMP